MKSLNYKWMKCSLAFMLLAVIIHCSKLKSSTTSTKSEIKLNSELALKNKVEMKVKLTTKFCNPLCRECSVNDVNYCTICQTGGLLYQFSCYLKCPEGTFLDNEFNECRKCSDNCPVCWGPEGDMCGTNPGLKTTVVFLEKEIKDFLTTYTFTRQEIEEWLSSLKIILDKRIEEKLVTELSTENFSTNDVYDNSNLEAELPLGSYSKLDGVFIPVPSYLNVNKELVNSHWVYKKGMWDGKRWVLEHFPRLPNFIKFKGEKNKIYYENQGYWIWDQMRNWYWVQSSILKEPNSSVHDVLSMLNTVKIDLGDYNRRKLQENQEIKKLKIQNNIRDFFDKFINTNVLIFSQLKNSINQEQNNMINSLDDLKSKVHNFFGEDSLEGNRNDDSTINNRQFLKSYNQNANQKRQMISNFLNKLNNNTFFNE